MCNSIGRKITKICPRTGREKSNVRLWNYYIYNFCYYFDFNKNIFKQTGSLCTHIYSVSFRFMLRVQPNIVFFFRFSFFFYVRFRFGRWFLCCAALKMSNWLVHIKCDEYYTPQSLCISWKQETHKKKPL